MWGSSPGLPTTISIFYMKVPRKEGVGHERDGERGATRKGDWNDEMKSPIQK